MLSLAKNVLCYTDSVDWEGAGVRDSYVFDRVFFFILETGQCIVHLESGIGLAISKMYLPISSYFTF